MKKVLIMIFALMLVVNVNASIMNNYSDSINSANSYIERFNDYAKYIVSDDNIKFKYENNVLSYNSNFLKGGFLNLSEFNISKRDDKTYLFTGQKYWTMTESGANSNVITSYTAELKSKTDTYGVRVTEYVNSDVEITGKGTYNDPWMFVKIESNEPTIPDTPDPNEPTIPDTPDPDEPTIPDTPDPGEPTIPSDLTYTIEDNTSCRFITTQGYWPSSTANGFKISVGLGEMPTEGYSVTISSVNISSSGVVINATSTSPGTNQTLQKTTYPCAVVTFNQNPINYTVKLNGRILSLPEGTADM